ncbi:acrosin-like [Empidonax traillii]|uniref:acrosin-like n=1 Tax=Empidonax traillii TaxID=164674 RepID=UPI000FFD7AFF|nr:acrosin-like [Empidonax traillii]
MRSATRIVGGVDVQPGDGAWAGIVSIRNVLTEEWTRHICGGTLIRPKWVLTAAHCFLDRKMWAVVAGATRIGEMGPHVQVRRIKKVHIHELYDAYVLYDIAVVELQQPMECTPSIQLACLPGPTVRVSRQHCYIAGWGDTYAKRQAWYTGQRQVGLPDSRGQNQGWAVEGLPLEGWDEPPPQSQTPVTQHSSASPEAEPSPREGLHPQTGQGNCQGAAGTSFLSLLTAVGPQPVVLKQSGALLIDTQLCNSSDWYGGRIQDYNLCGGYPEGGMSTCQGDSGGPLICQDSKENFFWEVGLTSWALGCARPKNPSVFISTQYFYNWIMGKIGHSSGAAPTPAPCPFPRKKLLQFFDLLQELLKFLKAKPA